MIEEQLNKISDRLIQIRKFAELNQTEFAERLSVTQPFIANLEKGKRGLSTEFALLLNDIFNISVEWLLLGKGTMFEPREYTLEPNRPPITLDNLSETLLRVEDNVRKSMGAVPKNVSPTVSPNVSPTQNLGYGTSNLPPLTVTLDASGNENIVLVDVKAAAGYPQGYLQPTFFKKLPVFSLPGANFHNGTFRAFEVEGDSMFDTLFHGDWVVCRYCTSVEEIREGYIHVIVTPTEVVVKRILNRITKYGKLILKSDNANYPPREVQAQDVKEIWLVKSFIGFNMPNRNLEVIKRLSSLETEVLDLNHRIQAIESGKKHK